MRKQLERAQEEADRKNKQALAQKQLKINQLETSLEKAEIQISRLSGQLVKAQAARDEVLQVVTQTAGEEVDPRIKLLIERNNQRTPSEEISPIRKVAANSGEFKLEEKHSHLDNKDTLRLGDQSTNRSIDDFRDQSGRLLKPTITEYTDNPNGRASPIKHAKREAEPKNEEATDKKPITVKVNSGQSQPFTKVIATNKRRGDAATSYDKEPKM